MHGSLLPFVSPWAPNQHKEAGMGGKTGRYNTARTIKGELNICPVPSKLYV